MAAGRAILGIAGIVVLLVGIATGLGIGPLSVSCGTNCGGGQAGIAVNPVTTSFTGLSGTITVTGGASFVASPVSVTLNVTGMASQTVLVSLVATQLAGSFTYSHVFPETFASAGNYFVQAFAMGNSLGSPPVVVSASSTVLTLTVTAPPPPTQIAASFSSSTTGAPLQICFTDTSGTPTGLTINGTNWKFGDGATGQGGSVCHVYASSGSYLVVMTAFAGSVSNTTSQTVVVNPPTGPMKVIPAFRWATSGLAVTFVDQTQIANGTINLISWTFGDGHTGTGSTAANTYLTAGVYTVKDTVTATRTGTTIAQTFSVTSHVIVNATCASSCGGGNTNQTSFPVSFSFNAPSGLVIGGGIGLLFAAAIPELRVRVLAALAIPVVGFVSGWFVGGLGVF